MGVFQNRLGGFFPEFKETLNNVSNDEISFQRSPMLDPMMNQHHTRSDTVASQ
jgi:hypothetical protein